MVGYLSAGNISKMTMTGEIHMLMKIRKRIHRASVLLSAALLSAALLSGCGEDAGVYRYDSVGSESETSASSVAFREEGSSVSEEKASPASGDYASPTVCYVYVCGAVNAPGVYELPAGSRVFEAIAKASGMTKEADGCSLNQAAPVEDGQQITVYTTEEVETLRKSGGAAGTGNPSGSTDAAVSAGESGKQKININTAGREELMTLKGIGAARAEAIITYREEHGAFSRIEDIMNVEGIKEKAFAKIRDDIVAE